MLKKKRRPRLFFFYAYFRIKILFLVKYIFKSQYANIGIASNRREEGL